MGRVRQKDAGLPSRVYRGRAGFEFHPKGGGSFKLAPLTASNEEIAAAHQGLIESLQGQKSELFLHHEKRQAIRAAKRAVIDAASTPEEKRKLRMKFALDNLFRTAKFRAAKCGRTYTITSEESMTLISRCQGACELTGITFDLDRKGCAIGPFSPSLDRIDSSRGYEFDNVRIVCAAINLAMNQWGEAMFEDIARSYLAHKEVLYRLELLGG
jgi:hypothetical protein